MTSPNRLAHPLTLEIAAGGERKESAIEKIRRALVRHGGNETAAAEALGCNPRTMRRWVAAYDLADQAAKLRKSAGIPGPRKKKEEDP